MTNINNYLKYTIYGLIFLVPFIPFIVKSSLFFPFITGKAFAFRFLVEIMFGLWAILAIRDERFRPKWSWVTICATVFVAIIGIADIFGENPMKSIWSNYERMEGWVTLVHLLGFLFVTSSVLKTKELWHGLFNTSIVASVFMGVYGLMQMAGKLDIHQGATRLDATLGNSAYLAVYMLVHIFLTTFLILKRKSWDVVVWLYGLALILQTIILYYTQTRGAMLGFIGGMFLITLVIAIFEKENKTIKKVAIGGLVGIVLLVGLFISVKNTSFVQDSPVLKRFADISLQEKTTKSRFMVWEMAWKGFKEKPILGWGQENFNYVFDKHYNPGMYDQEQWFDRTHNVFFDWLIAGGLLGLLGYLSLFFAIIFYLIKDENEHFKVIEKAVIVGLLAGYFIHNFFVFDHLISYILFFLILGYIHSLNKKESSVSFELSKKVEQGAVVVVCFAIIFSVYLFNAKGYLANTNLLKAIAQPPSKIDESIEYYKKALSYESFGDQEIRERLAEATPHILRSSEINDSAKQTFADLTFGEMDKQVKKDSQSARANYIMAVFLVNAGMLDLSLEYLSKAMSLSPNKQTMLVLGGQIYINQSKYSEAVESFKKAYELGTQFKELEDKYILALMKAGQYNEAIGILETNVEKNPTDAQMLLSLAAGYSEAGFKSKAIETIQQVIVLDPTFKEQGEYYISEIRAGRQ